MSAYEPRHAAHQPEPCHHDDDWQVPVAAFLMTAWHLRPPDVIGVLKRCGSDRDLREFYLWLATGEKP